MRADRWQTGDCGAYAFTLIQKFPELRLGAVKSPGTAFQEGGYLHFFAHDDHQAYDSRGAHPLPYISVWDSVFRDYFTHEAATGMGFECVLDLDPADFRLADFEREMMPAARAHIRRHGVDTMVMVAAISRADVALPAREALEALERGGEDVR